MALSACTDCGQQVSDAADACPGCGRPTDRREFTRAVVLSIVVVVVLVIAYVVGVNVAGDSL